MLHRRTALGLIAGTLTAPSLKRARAATGDPLKIVALESLSGPGSEQNHLFSSGVRYGVMKMNEAGGFNGQPVQFAEYDTGGTHNRRGRKDAHRAGRRL